MYLICADLEGIFVPEIWINVAERTGIKELKLTTRDISDYDVLMKKRIGILQEHGLKLADIQSVIAKMDPMDGALEFINWVRAETQIIIVSDTFVEFAGPLMKRLGYPTLLCNTLTIGSDGMVSNYNLRQHDGKRKVTMAMQKLNYKVIGVGDSYNDITMLQTADRGILYRPPANVIEEYPDLPVTTDFSELKKIIQKTLCNGQ
jgi:phosphoserine/homoserine phosphotransferase